MHWKQVSNGKVTYACTAHSQLFYTLHTSYRQLFKMIWWIKTLSFPPGSKCNQRKHITALFRDMSKTRRILFFGLRLFVSGFCWSHASFWGRSLWIISLFDIWMSTFYGTSHLFNYRPLQSYQPLIFSYMLKSKLWHWSQKAIHLRDLRSFLCSVYPPISSLSSCVHPKEALNDGAWGVCMTDLGWDWALESPAAEQQRAACKIESKEYLVIDLWGFC